MNLIYSYAHSEVEVRYAGVSWTINPDYDELFIAPEGIDESIHKLLQLHVVETLRELAVDERLKLIAADRDETTFLDSLYD